MAASTLGRNEGDDFSSYRPMAEINVTPFVDVMLVLLVIFMVAAPLMMVSVPLDLPKTSAAQITPKDGPIVISLNHDGQIFIQDNEVDDASLVDRLAQVHDERPDAIVYVRGDKGIDYGKVMDILGKVGRAGFAKISLVAEPAPGTAQ
jgi:biopolymer transport protein TolR